MANLSTQLWEAQEQCLEAIRAKWEGLSNDAGKAYGRERYSDNLNKYVDLIAIKDTANGNKTVIRVCFVKFLGSQPLDEDASSCRTPQRLRYQLEFLYQFEDTRKDGSNSTDGFNKVIMEAVQEFDQDRELGYDELYHTGLTTVEDALVEPYDKEVLVHRIVKELSCDIFKFD